MSPKQAVREFCKECVGNNSHQVKSCGGDKMLNQGDKTNQCLLYPFRNGRGRPTVKLIRRFCLECLGGSRKLVRECQNPQCPLYSFRFGKNPNRAHNNKKNCEKNSLEEGVLV